AVTSANTSMAAQQTILTKNVASLEDVDATTLSTTVTNLQTQLQDSYSLTSQLKSLSLVNYLTAG
ncbi:MAG: flagellin, partial [Candidatus Pacebacteria bacterium]|nr:flagellin [Candidatus Paceibacterota bacterium]